MNLILFLYALEHVARICRVIRHPWGHALLVGVGGSGRQSLTRLAGAIEDYAVLGIEISRAYTWADWKDDLKRILKSAGEKGKDTIFLFNDMQITDEAMVEDISNLLNTGEVPNLFDSGEQAGIGENIRAKAKKAKMDGSRQQLYAFFVQEVKAHLHVVLAFSPVGEDFRNRLRLFPSLVTCTTINWFAVWPHDALWSVAERTLEPLEDLDASQKEKVSSICMEFHFTARDLSARYLAEAGRYFYTTPTMYLQLLENYISLKGSKQEELQTKQSRYEVGLEKLLSTASQVSEMQEELTALKPQLEVSSKETDALMEKIATETAEADKVKLVVSSEEAKANEEAAKVQAIKDDCESDLQQAMPLLENAIKALDTLTKNDISEVKGMKSPPAPVKLVMEAVCILKGLGPTKLPDPKTGQMRQDWWVTSISMLNDMGFLDSLRNFDRDNIPPAVINKIKPYLKNPDFQPKKIKKVSKAAFGLCSWVRAMEAYDRVLKVVRPKQAALKDAQGQLDVVNAALAEKQAELKSVEDKLEGLNSELLAAQEKKRNLEDEVKLCTEKLTRAQALISGLGGERARWTEAAQELAKLKVQVVGDTLIAAGMVSYFGPFTSQFRESAAERWCGLLRERGIPLTEPFSLVATLGDPVKIQQWNLHGLPKDEFSANNAIVMHSSPKFALCIDPQGQANKWFRSMEAEHDVIVTKLEDARFMRMLETGLQYGRPVLLENVGTALDGSLDPVLNRERFRQGGTQMVRLGDNVVEWHPQFRFYITTKLRNPHYTPEVCTKVALINFMITPEGLQDQLLGIVVAQERPDLEEQKSKLVIQAAENNAKLQEVENQILHVLSTSEGNILEDGEAVAVLQEAKRVSDDIGEKQKVALTTEASIDEARVNYNQVAKYASVLFFTIVEIGNIDPMYQYSLAYFIQLFLRSIKESPNDKSWDVAQRLEALSEYFTFFLYTNVCRSLFEKDKVLFAFKLAVNLRMAEGLVDAGDLRFLLTGGVAVGDNPHENPAREWLPEKAWTELWLLDMLPAFEGIREAVAQDPLAWKPFVDSSNPHTSHLPGEWDRRLSAFQKLLVLRALRPDKIVQGVASYVVESMGSQYVEPQEFNLSLVYADSLPSVPLLFVLSQGSDPMADLLLFAESKSRPVETVSLGQGQEAVALRKVEDGIANGSWVVLQNCHLAKSFLPKLEDVCEKGITAAKVHHEFRLWLTSYPSDIFPVSILENSLKMTNEPPKGLRAGLERIYKSDPITENNFWEGCNKPEQFHSMLYALAFFHCLVQQRCLYGPVGWNIPYAFNENDLRISQRQLKMFLDEYDDPPLQMLRYTCGECNYGGKVTDAKDRLLLMTILMGFYCREVLEVENAPLSESGRYLVPKPGDYQSYLEHMAQLPLVEEPDVFGLHENATITKDLKDANQMLSSLLLTQSKSGAGSNKDEKSTEDTLFDTATDILDRLPENFDLEAAQMKYPVTYGESMNTVLCQELGRANVLLDVIRNTMEDLKKAVKGLILMSETMDVVGQSLFNGKVPEIWLKRSFPSLKPLGPYVKEVIERCDFFRQWFDHGPPTVFWLSGFFFTQAFLTGAKQNFARKYQIPIDQIDFDFQVMDGEGDVEVPPLDGVFVRGAFLEAAAWDYGRHLLRESRPKELFSAMPPMAFLPCEIAKVAPPPSYSAPMYKTTERRGVLSTTGHSTNFVMDVRIPTDKPESHWIKRGCALITSLDD
uniref:Dynein heavy chain 9 n=2 Tax=Tetraselmis sp. GSL018 TaxID=582737 RepID=A0A061R4I5_9CHLO